MDEETNVIDYPAPQGPKEQLFTITLKDGATHVGQGFGLFLHTFLCISETWDAQQSSDIKQMFNTNEVLHVVSEDVPVAN